MTASDLVATAEVPVADRLPGASRAISFTYCSEGARGEERTATAALHLPSPTDRPAPILVFCHGTSGVGEHCPVSPILNQVFGSDLGDWVNAGFAVLAVDYAGLGSPGPHAYLHRDSTARQVLDALCAAHRLGRSESLHLSRQWVLLGGSQGGHAALAAAAERGRAPDCDLRAVIALAPPVDVSYVLRFAAPWVPWLPVPDLVAYLSYVLHGLEASTPQVSPALDQALTPSGRTLVDSSPWYGYAQLVQRTRRTRVGAMLRTRLGHEVITPLREATLLPPTNLQVPVFIGQGIIDPVVPWPVTARYVRRCRALGAHIHWRTYRSAHDVWTAARGEALQFALDNLTDRT